MLDRLFRPIDIAPLVYFRVLGALLITTEILGQLFTHAWADLTRSAFHFSYPYFEWVRPWPASGMLVHFAITGLAGIAVAAGWHYRASAILFWISGGWLFLMDRSLYINHLYLYNLIAFILIFLPANRALSLDVRRRPEIASTCAPAWTRQILLFQIGVVYLFAGLAKLDADWLAGRPMSLWLSARADYPLIGGLLAESWLPLLMSRAGLLFDLLVIPAMLWRRTRVAAFVFAAFFHLINVSIFGIGTFPWFSLMITALFFPPERFRRLPILRTKLPPYRPEDYGASVPRARRNATAALLLLYVLVQLVVPLRRTVYPGPTRWTEAGHQFSWRMMLRTKRGKVDYRVRDPATGRRWREDPRDYLTPHQYRDMIGKPAMILQFAHFLVEEYVAQGVPDVEVTGNCRVSLNGRRLRQYVEPGRDLARERQRIDHDWIVPFEEE